MFYTTWAALVYKILFYADKFNVNKNVLDCGAGGFTPPLYIFYSNTYQVEGIDISQKAIEKSNQFEKEHNCKLNINIGDMRNLKHKSETFGCCYSYNSIFHMKKDEVIQSIHEMIRVTQPGGIIYFNLLSKKDSMFGVGNIIEETTFGNGDSIHSYYDDEEIDSELDSCVLLEKAYVNYIRYQEKTLDQSFIEYYLRKK